MSKTVFCSVIFPANLPYFQDFINSLKNQSDTNFTLLLFNDGVADLEKYLRDSTLNYRIENCQGTIPETRSQIFGYLKKAAFSKIIFGDTDDYFSENRVEECKKLLNDFDVVANDLILVANDKTILSELFWKNRKEIKQPISLESIKTFNFLGLGNTAVNQKILPNEIQFNSNLIAIDWYLFSVILQSPVSVVFSSNSHVFYRQHEANIIGRKKLTFADFRRGVDVKLNHYCTLALLYPDFKELANQIKEFKANLSEKKFNSIQKKQKVENPFWWEEI
jgi:hypothetical protein